MKPGGGGKASGELLQLIERDFGSFDRFVQEFKSAAATQFGSGWAWLTRKIDLDAGNAVNPRPSEEDKKLVVVKSPSAVKPPCLMPQFPDFPLHAIDAWENRRPDYTSTSMEKLVFSARLEVAKARAAEREIEEARKKKEELYRQKNLPRFLWMG
ncbi:hypothetical protein Peur_035211 [Populus x canadensis]